MLVVMNVPEDLKNTNKQKFLKSERLINFSRFYSIFRLIYWTIGGSGDGTILMAALERSRNNRKPPSGEPLQYDPDFQGPLKRRSCTDVICLMFFLVFVACWVGIGIYAYHNGDPSTLLVPRDSAGSRCGFDSHVKDRPYLFFFDLTQCLDATVPFTGCKTTQVCVSYCPSENYIPGGTTELDKHFCSYYDTSECPEWYLKSSALLKRCLYNVAERKKLKNANVANVQGDEISAMRDFLNPFHLWFSLVVDNGLSFVTKNETVHQVSRGLTNTFI
ncbi:hypothetical protein NQ318_013735 [Aromia moschata]|uniref:Uncharacterized protein n=1 Tax=Aromia moschata TaxID=1265417 RepID=A0AAV8Z8E2_9CUCU|nr:hypothetical protein NQ318_013735 [Aromia moschata]